MHKFRVLAGQPFGNCAAITTLPELSPLKSSWLFGDPDWVTRELRIYLNFGCHAQ